MKKILLSTAILGLAGISFATNGDNLIGVSPASRGMGGIGVGMPVGPTDTIFRNPAWMSYYKGFNMSFGGILFMPEVKAKTNVTPMGPMNPP
ncbi:MAG: aromatic hydrocarbon degradation protein, partial [Aquificaceae bacterium]|nr:aromatic hydrocarbon degradation protein [Aquificaceae bacterium]MDW8423852.1 aromatic hydrocarbon degradation protein [Aquificaceae bacterium]